MEIIALLVFFIIAVHGGVYIEPVVGDDSARVVPRAVSGDDNELESRLGVPYQVTALSLDDELFKNQVTSLVTPSNLGYTLLTSVNHNFPNHIQAFFRMVRAGAGADDDDDGADGADGAEDADGADDDDGDADDDADADDDDDDNYCR